MKTTIQKHYSVEQQVKNSLMGVLLFMVGVLCLPNVSQAQTTSECDIPNHIVCDYSNPEGIYKVVVTGDFGKLGKIDVVNEQFGCSTSATISYDPVAGGQAYTTVVTPCNNGAPPPKLKWAPKGTPPFKSKAFRVVPNDSSRRIQSKPIVTDYIKVVHPEGDTNSGKITCDTIAACEFVAVVCDLIGGVGECYGDHCECNTKSESKEKSSLASRF